MTQRFDNEYSEQTTYKLRSSGASSIGSGNFLVQSFGVDENLIVIYPATQRLPVSSDFVGASITGDFVSANFQRLAALENGQQVFSGQTVDETIFNEQLESTFLGQISRD